MTSLDPDRQEFDHRALKLFVGLIALFLASATSLFSQHSIRSISASYYVDGWASDVFVGSLFAIAALMAAYNGFGWQEMLLSKGAAIAAVCVAMFPCDCGGHPQSIPMIHYAAAAIMFLILAALCYVFFRRALSKQRTGATRRAWVYAACGIIIVLSIVVLAVYNVTHTDVPGETSRFVFYCEASALIAFGAAWLAASHILPGITDSEERWLHFPRQP
jgi:Protein of unknown function (DUF998)